MSGDLKPNGVRVIVCRIVGQFSDKFEVSIVSSNHPKYLIGSIHHMECIWHAANEGYTVSIMPASLLTTHQSPITPP